MRHQNKQWDLEFAAKSELFFPLTVAAKYFKECKTWPAYDLLNTIFKKQSIVSGGRNLLKAISPDCIVNSPPYSYEVRCYLTGELETRSESWHDFLNALVWLTFPHSKGAINSRHYGVLSTSEDHKVRSKERDALTLFDECGVIVISSDEELNQLIRNFSWKEVFWNKRERTNKNLKAFIFGHGLYEQALTPYVGLTGKAILLTVEKELLTVPLAEQLIEIDKVIHKEINNNKKFLTPIEFSPLPILGIPGWFNEQDENFYNNADYFRPGRKLFNK